MREIDFCDLVNIKKNWIFILDNYATFINYSFPYLKTWFEINLHNFELTILGKLIKSLHTDPMSVSWTSVSTDRLSLSRLNVIWLVCSPAKPNMVSWTSKELSSRSLVSAIVVVILYVICLAFPVNKTNETLNLPDIRKKSKRKKNNHLHSAIVANNVLT